MKRGTGDHPKTHRLARFLGVRPVEALGILNALLDWAYYNAIRGDVGKWDDHEIAAGARCEHVAGPDFVRALTDAGWLDRHPTHRLVIHDLDQHADDTWKKQVARKGWTFANLDCVQTSLSEPTDRAEQTPDNVQTLPGNVRAALPSLALPNHAEPGRAGATPDTARAPESVIWGMSLGLAPISELPADPSMLISAALAEQALANGCRDVLRCLRHWHAKRWAQRDDRRRHQTDWLGDFSAWLCQHERYGGACQNKATVSSELPPAAPGSVVAIMRGEKAGTV